MSDLCGGKEGTLLSAIFLVVNDNPLQKVPRFLFCDENNKFLDYMYDQWFQVPSIQIQ